MEEDYSSKRNSILLVPGTRMSVGLRFFTDKAPTELEGMIKHPAPPGAKMQNYYWKLRSIVQDCPDSIQLAVPPGGENAERCELRFGWREDDFLVTFGRHGENEKGPFTFKKNDDGTENYVSPALHPMEREGAHCRNFNPLYIRIDHWADTNIYVLKAKWENGLISISVTELGLRDPAIPDFLL